METRPLSVALTLITIMAGLLFALPLRAQEADGITRNPRDLAGRFLGFDAAFAIPLPTPIYRPGDTLDFWVNKRGREGPSQITAELAAATPTIYLWVEEGHDFEGRAMQSLAGLLEASVLSFTAGGKLGLIADPQGATGIASGDFLPLPDVDNDPHLFILFARDLREEAGALRNPNDSLPREFVPGGYSNEHEVIIAHTSNFPDTPLSDAGVYSTLLTRAIFELLVNEHNPGQAAWLKEALNWNAFLNLQQTAVPEEQIAAFLQSVNLPLNSLPGLSNSAALRGGQQLFFEYLAQRFGGALIADLYDEPGAGFAAFDRILAANGISDPVTGAPVTVREVYADFALANALNTFFGDGRYVYTRAAFPQGATAASASLIDRFNVDFPGQQVNQFSTLYLRLRSSMPRAFTLTFDGQLYTDRLPFPEDRERENHFYWSRGDANRDHTLTRALDLRGVDDATLEFDTWYDLADGWNYAYVTVSTDDGATWAILPPELSGENPRGIAYGPGFTGGSNPEGDRPFPFLGVSLDANGITITSIQPGEAVSQTEIQPGDTIVGHDGEVWPGQPDLLGLLANYAPGDTVNLYIQRGAQRFDVPVTLGVHPTRIIRAEPLWLAERVDLSAYGGEEILLRFEYISQLNMPDSGIAIDNIAIPELDFMDDAESENRGWALRGWQRVDNRLPQNFLLQAATINSDNPANNRVRPLIGPHDEAVHGTWRFALEPGEEFVLAISGLNDDTAQPGHFDLSISEGATNT